MPAELFSQDTRTARFGHFESAIYRALVDQRIHIILVKADQPRKESDFVVGQGEFRSAGLDGPYCGIKVFVCFLFFACFAIELSQSGMSLPQSRGIFGRVLQDLVIQTRGRGNLSSAGSDGGRVQTCVRLRVGIFDEFFEFSGSFIEFLSLVPLPEVRESHCQIARPF